MTNVKDDAYTDSTHIVSPIVRIWNEIKWTDYFYLCVMMNRMIQTFDGKYSTKQTENNA